jgi:hypothetical protein
VTTKTDRFSDLLCPQGEWKRERNKEREREIKKERERETRML